MTLQELLDLSAATLTASTVDERAALGLALARGFMERLGESQPCGLDEPEVHRHPSNDFGHVWQPAQWHQMGQTPENTDHMARMLLVAADEARAKEDSNG